MSSLNWSPEYLLPAPLLHLGVEGEVEQRPLEGGGGGLRPRQQEVEQIDGEVVLVEPLVLLHGGQVNVDEVLWVFSVQSSTVFDYLI